MTTKKPIIPQELQAWIDARQRRKLSHAHIQMARDLGMNPKEMGKIDNHHQEPWKAPLPIFIESLYRKRFHRERPEVVRTIEEIAAMKLAKKVEQKARKVASRAAAQDEVAVDRRESQDTEEQREA